MTSVTDFGRQLLRTGDLDPVYVALHGANLPPDTLARLCLAYWCFYHLGAAAQLAEIKQPSKFWDAMMHAARNEGLRPDGSKPWPRGAERRHFRGHQAVEAMAELSNRYPHSKGPIAVAGMLGVRPFEAAPTTYSAVARSVQTHRGFGPWIAFKIADMSERLLGCNTDFSDCHLGIYKDPRQGAAVALLEWSPRDEAREYEGLRGLDAKPWEYPISDGQLADTVTHYVKVFKGYKAPPDSNRPVNVQEVETIFCKYKSHLKGHYPPGKDTRELRHGLKGWGDLADELRRHLPRGE